jgi:hypothetical protein
VRNVRFGIAYASKPHTMPVTQAACFDTGQRFGWPGTQIPQIPAQRSRTVQPPYHPLQAVAQGAVRIAPGSPGFSDLVRVLACRVLALTRKMNMLDNEHVHL